MYKRRIIVGISGATGIVYGVRLLQCLRELQVETHLVVSSTGELTRACETEISSKELREFADVHYSHRDLAAPISSGSFLTMGMIVAPCSMRTLAEIAIGATGSLLSRSADVCLKERRRLVLLARETPLSLSHLRNMIAVTEMGGVVFPPVPAFYGLPRSIDDIISHTVGRVLDLFGIENDLPYRWGEASSLSNIGLETK